MTSLDQKISETQLELKEKLLAYDHELVPKTVEIRRIAADASIRIGRSKAAAIRLNQLSGEIDLLKKSVNHHRMDNIHRRKLKELSSPEVFIKEAANTHENTSRSIL